jgi:hypothetical protein
VAVVDGLGWAVLLWTGLFMAVFPVFVYYSRYYIHEILLVFFTAVTLSASVTDVVEITKFYVSQSAAGSITLHEDSGSGTELGKITQGQTSARYQQIALWPTPSAAWTYTVDGERDLPDLSNSNDEPLIPSRFHRLLVDYALWKEFEKIDDTRGQQAYGRWQNGVSQLKYFLTCPPDFLPISGKSQALGRSRLGPYYPKD